MRGTPFPGDADIDQIYEQILSIQNEIPIFYPACGVLLRDDLHHAFDRLEFSFYSKVGFEHKIYDNSSSGAGQCSVRPLFCSELSRSQRIPWKGDPFWTL